MASSTPFDGTNFLTGAPDEDQPHGNDYQEHQSTRKSMEFVNNKEHTAIGNDPSAANAGGEHKNGSSVAYFASTAPTLRPDGLTALADNDVDKGRTWFDSTFDPPVMMKWNGSAWAQAGNKVLNGTFYTSVNEADDGTTDLIKAGRNVADDADVPFIPDSARLATNAAPVEDTEISNKKYVDDSIAAAHPTYTGGESHTDGSGLIFKHGIVLTNPDTDPTVSFGASFPNDIVSANVSGLNSSAVSSPPHVLALSSSQLQIGGTSNMTGFSWQAWGW